MLTVVAIVLVFGVLVAVHELGHFLVAKAFGMPVDEYSLGFGPHIFTRRFGETQYSLRIIPLGGYVRVAGMDGQASDNPRVYTNRPLWERFLVIFAGPIMNLLLAFLLYVVLYGPVGVPTVTTMVVHVMPHYPAAAAGIRSGDRIVAIDGTRVSNYTQLESAIAAHAKDLIRVTVSRGHRQFTRLVHTRYDKSLKERLIGIEMQRVVVHQGIINSVKTGIVQTVQLTGEWFVALYNMVTGHTHFMSDVAGPVGIAVMVGQAARAGLAYLLLLAAALSLNLGLFNVLPVPVLDGSRLFLIGIEAIRGRPMDPDHESMIHLVGMALLIVFVVFVTYHEVVQYIH